MRKLRLDGFYLRPLRLEAAPSGWALALGLLLLLAILGGLYLGSTLLIAGQLGFPLDDSWIHQTFARNLVRDGELALNKGEPVAALTAPLWTLLLAVGYLLGLDYRLWAYLLGLGFLALAGWAVFLLARSLFPERGAVAPLAALGTVLEWHLLWAGVSGMETTLFTLLTLLLLYRGVRELGRPGGASQGWGLGAMGALVTLARPEGAVLFFLLILFLIGSQPLRRIATHLLTGLLAFLVVLSPVLAFNYFAGGSPLPITFYAKHAFYAQPLAPLSVLRYLYQVALNLFSGSLLLLLPGIAYALFRLPTKMREERSLHSWSLLLPLAWVILLPTMYLVRLPALFHHGRYLMPLIPILALYGIWGLSLLLRIIPYRLFTLAYLMAILLLYLVMAGNGAVVYAWDVRFINDEQVAIAQWLRENTPPEAWVATHDVGAIGYFSGRRILDTAGLTNPETASFPRDEARLRALILERGINYVALFPKWYPRLAQDPLFEVVHRLDYRYAVEQGADNMIVLRLRRQ